MAQIWPKDDSFSADTPFPQTSGTPTFFSGYLRSVHPGFNFSFSGSTYLVTGDVGELTDGYSSITPINTIPDAGGQIRIPKVANFSSPNLPSFGALGSCQFRNYSALWRPYYDDQCTSSAVFKVRSVLGALNSQSFKNASVFVKANQGVSSGSYPAEQISITDGYAFFLCNNTIASNYAYILVRWNGGVATRLQSAVILQSALTVSKPFKLSLSCLNSGADIRLIATVAVWNNGTLGSDVTVFDYTDTSASKILGNGRAGFGMGSFDDTGNNPPSGPACKSTHLCLSYEIRDTGTNAVVFRDEWQRALPGASQSNATEPTIYRDRNSVTGRSLNQFWQYDCHLAGSKIPNSLHQELRYDSALGAPYVENTTYAKITGLAFGKPSQSLYGSDRQANFRINNWASGRTLGIFSRGSVIENYPSTSADPAYTSYGAYQLLGQNVSGQYRFIIAHNYNGSSVILGATALQSLAAWGLALNSYFTLRLALQNVGQGSPALGNVRIKGLLNGTQLDFDTNFSNPSGISFDGLDMVDSRSIRTLSGSIEGVNVDAATGIGNRIYFDAWQDNYVPPIPDNSGDPSTLEEDMASIAIVSECFGKTGTLTTPYDWGIEEQSKYISDSFNYEADYFGKLLRHTRSRRSWKISANAITDSERNTLLNFWRSHKGSQIPFDWVEPETGSTVAVRFGQEDLAIILANPGVRQFSFILSEVFC